MELLKSIGRGDAGDYLKGAGTGLAAISQYSAGRSVEQQLRQRAGQTRATSQRDAEEQRRQAALVSSRAQAVAAAGGGSGPGVVNLIAGIEAEGDYRARMALAEGDDSARGDEFAGKIKAREGRARAMSTVLSYGGDLYEKYNTRKTV